MRPDPDDGYTVQDAAEDTGVSEEEAREAWDQAASDASG